MSTVPYINPSSEKEKKNYKRDRIESTMKREHIFMSEGVSSFIIANLSAIKKQNKTLQ
jgi:hypothetical protein